MNKIIIALMLQVAFFSTSSHSNYEVISKDYIVGAEQIVIEFGPSIVKKSAKVEFQPCVNCEWVKAQTTNDTQYFNQYLQVDFNQFKKQVKSYLHNPPKEGYRALISIDKRNNNIFNIKWNYVEL